MYIEEQRRIELTHWVQTNINDGATLFAKADWYDLVFTLAPHSMHIDDAGNIFFADSTGSEAIRQYYGLEHGQQYYAFPRLTTAKKFKKEFQKYFFLPTYIRRRRRYVSSGAKNLREYLPETEMTLYDTHIKWGGYRNTGAVARYFAIPSSRVIDWVYDGPVDRLIDKIYKVWYGSNPSIILG